METSLYPSIYLSFPFALPLFPFPFFSLFSRRAEGKLAASFSLPKGLFKLETLQSPHPPPPVFSLSLIHFLPLFLGRGDSHLPVDSLQGPVNARQLCFVDGSGRERGGGLTAKRRGNEGGKVEVGEWELERGQGRPVSRCTLVSPSSHGSFHTD